MSECLLRQLRRVPRNQLLERAVSTGACLHHLAAAAGDQLAGLVVGADEQRRSRVAHAQAGQQGLGSVGAAGDLVARERRVQRGQRIQLRLQALWLDSFHHKTLRQERRVRYQRRHGDCRDGRATQQGDHAQQQPQAVAAAELFDLVGAGKFGQRHVLGRR